MDCSPSGFSVHGILQVRILEWVAMPSSRGPSPPRDQTHVSYISCIGRQVLYPWCHLGSPNEIVLKKRRIIQSLVLKQVDTFWKKICSFLPHLPTPKSILNGLKNYTLKMILLRAIKIILIKS